MNFEFFKVHFYFGIVNNKIVNNEIVTNKNKQLWLKHYT